MTKKLINIFFIILFLFCIFLSFNKHSKDKAHSYHGVIWADAAGYYVHLPIWFIYGNKASELPGNISEQLGNGFYVDAQKNKIVTKYYCGSAILMTPFFLTSHFLAKPWGFPADGFSKIYSYGIYFSGIFYCCLGMYFLTLFLLKHFSTNLSIITVLIFFLTTNLYYYSIDSPGMSHVYSFFLFSLFLWSTQKLLIKEKSIYYLLFSASLVCSILVRPTNIIIVLFPFFYENGLFINRIRILLQNKMAVMFSIVVGILLVLPQLIYQKQTYGSILFYSYGDEGFTNLKTPKLLETWFSPNNGLFIYAPILILSLIGMILMIRNKDKLGYYLLLTFFLISYIFASWWNWWFGCSLGARSFIEYYTLLSIPLAITLKAAWDRLLTKSFIIIFVSICIIMYFNIEYYYDGCFYGGTWDWKALLKLLEL